VGRFVCLVRLCCSVVIWLVICGWVVLMFLLGMVWVNSELLIEC